MNIELKNVTKTYDSKPVIKDFSYIFENGKQYLLKGDSGSGKTTTINVILGLTTPTSGSVTSDNRYSVVFQEDRLLEEFSSIDNLRFVNPSLDVQTISSHLSRLIPGADITLPVKAFSGGMKRRVAIARAILAESDVVIMDEPFTGLDRASAELALMYIKENRGCRTLIITTHVYDTLPEFVRIDI